MAALWVSPARVGWDGLATLALSLLVILLTGGATLLLVFLQVRHLARHATCPECADCLLVLGVRLEDGRPGRDYRRRLLRALQLARRNPQARIWILGGQTSASGPSEAAAGAVWLREHGVAETRICCEDQSRHTLENLRHARDLMAGDPGGCDGELVLITSRFHLARAVGLARGLGLLVRPCPAERCGRAGTCRPGVLVREAVLLHWYHTGLRFARLIRHRGMLERIS
ncbi:MAG: YdcF family protein [Pseudomonadota bacterium]